MNDAHPDTDWSDCDDECEPGRCTCDEAYPSAAILIACIVLAAFVAGACAAWRAWA